MSEQATVVAFKQSSGRVALRTGNGRFVLAEQTDAIASQAVREFSINPLNIEAAVRQQLLPLYFMALKTLGLGMDQVQALVEQVVQIIRAGARKA